jgi:hypothetical protein
MNYPAATKRLERNTKHSWTKRTNSTGIKISRKPPGFVAGLSGQAAPIWLATWHEGTADEKGRGCTSTLTWLVLSQHVCGSFLDELAYLFQ